MKRRIEEKELLLQKKIPMSTRSKLIRVTAMLMIGLCGVVAAGCHQREPNNPLDAKASAAPPIDYATSTGAGGSSISGGISSSTSGTGAGGSALP
jgi:hypothetical protein